MHSTDWPSAVRVPVRYAECWADGFGVRGWKLDLPGAGADVIAATPHAGERIATSVFVHDIYSSVRASPRGLASYRGHRERARGMGAPWIGVVDATKHRR